MINQLDGTTTNNAERVYDESHYVGIVHEFGGKWYATIPKKNVFWYAFRTCGNGIVREPTERQNQCSPAPPKTWDTKEAAIRFIIYHSRRSDGW